MAQPDMVIPPASNSISSMLERDPSMKAPVEDQKLVVEHRAILDNVKQKATKELEEDESPDIILKPRTPGLSAQAAPREAKFKRGDKVWDTEKEMKVIVTKEAIGYSNKGTPFHRVTVSRTGESWIQLEKLLRKL